MADFDGTFTFAEWVKHEAGRIPRMGLTVKDPADAQAYMELNIEAALRKAYRQGMEGKGEDNFIPPVLVKR